MRIAYSAMRPSRSVGRCVRPLPVRRAATAGIDSLADGSRPNGVFRSGPIWSDMPIMLSREHGEAPTELQAAFARYRAAQTALRGLRKPSLDEVEAALAARVELFR